MDEVYLPPGSQRTLVKLSRDALEGFVRGATTQARAVEDPYLKTPRLGAFVSLHNGGDLRGCIGTCFPSRPLCDTVIEMTEAAASRDYRVAPIEAGELPHIRIDISVLSPLRRAEDPLALEAGRDGLHVARGVRSGVLLPQVATQYRWDMKTFVEQTCIKAGLPKSAWQWPDTSVSTFRALIIEER